LQDKWMFAGEQSKKISISRNYTSYLDVSEYILKEYSPQIKPSSPHHQHDQVTFFEFLIHKLSSYWLLFSPIIAPIS